MTIKDTAATVTKIWLLTASVIWVSCNQPPPDPPEKIIAQTLLAQVDSFAALCNTLQHAVEHGSSNDKQLRELFLQTRMGYKKMEWATEYFEPATARFVNGPPVQEVEADGQVLEPAGLQVIESYLYPAYDSTRKEDLLRQLHLLPSACVRFKRHFANIDILDWQVFDAAKLEVFRIMTLGITGFDDPLSLESIRESAAALSSLENILPLYAHAETLLPSLREASIYLGKHPGFDSFNRAEFITAYANPLSTAITDQQQRLKMKIIRYNRLLNQDAKTLFDPKAFNVDAYMPDAAAFMTDEKILLGRRLFADPLLSGTGTRSCQSCHQPDKAFADGLLKNTIIGGHKLLSRNTPTLINAALQPSLFYDLRAKSLEDQALAVVQNEKEMHGSIKLSVTRLWEDTSYRRLFASAFPKKDRIDIDTLEVMNALGSYVRSLTYLNSRFDEYMRGNKAALNDSEIEGFNLFMGKAKCGTCHYMPLFSGVFPPRFMKMESEVIGVPQSMANRKIDPDRGRYEVIKVPSFMHSFKTPALRNIARTAPYMHNGVFNTLEEVIDFYNKGGGAGLGLKMDNQTLPFDKLDLTEHQRNEIVAFMKSLDSQYPSE
ncbi:cytochrome c peroxidase [Flavitalea sp. BT771]|uniref:cytochrome-c peroxidase n=1 Tax=Flavitalea sp. BT771 TaxID=3063329 RepID=UPI0026E4079A|nr:cytochrome c peroxidase [Flavitalea sp. BT771]MDO6430447.1 cytochrome c peroxidase [Flavitalea sp. BT771]MDV6219413.1 cytochrome c peroxidase [Flavitalea sp. BT771]